jgi:hypothetical protein
MKKITFLLLIVSAGIFITSCEKPVSESSNGGKALIENNIAPVLTSEYREALLATVNSLKEQNEGERGAEFLPVFFTQQAFYVFDEPLTKIATFTADLDENDFFRANPDGTYTVHIASNNAFCELFDYTTFSYYYGYNGQMVMNYSGPADLIGIYDPSGNLLGYIYFVLYPNNVSPATVWHGHGPVQLMGEGPVLNLMGKLTATAKWKKVMTSVELN